MANPNSGNGFAKCFILFMAIMILLQGAVYVGLAVWGLVYGQCSDEVLSFTSQPFQTITKLIYFTYEDCGQPRVQFDGNIVPLNIDWEISSDVTTRTYILLIAYTVVSSVWILSSLLVIITILGRITSKVVTFVYWPWFVVICIGTILDLTATGFHINDIIHTTDAYDTFEYIGLEVPGENAWDEALAAYTQYFITPSILMTCLSTRIVIVWFLNIIGGTFALAVSQKIADAEKTQMRNDHQQHQHQHQHNNNNNNKPTSQPDVVFTPQARQVSVVEQMPPAPQTPQPVSPVTTQQYQYPAASQVPYNRNSSRMTMESGRVPAEIVVASRPPSIQGKDTYRNTDTHPDNLDYPYREVPKPARQLSTDTPLNSRYSEIFQNQPRSGPVNDELRSQLPWSYTNIANPQALRKTQLYPQVIDEDVNQTNNFNNDNASQAYSRW